MTEQSDVQKPVGPFEDVDSCVRHFEGDEDVEDAEALCGWMENNPDLSQKFDPDDGGIIQFVESLKDSAAENILTNLKVTYVSGVDNPAIDSQWVYAKDAASSRSGADWGVDVPFLLPKSKTVVTESGARAPVWSPKGKEEAEDADDEPSEEQKAWAPVLIPNETDKQGDVIPADEIEAAAHDFLTDFRNIDTDHDLFDGKGVPVESWTLKESQTFTMPDGTETREYPAGTWMMGVQFADEAWKRIKEGDLTGFSIYGEAEELDVEGFLAGDVEPSKASEANTTVAMAVKGLQSEPNTMGNENENGAGAGNGDGEDGGDDDEQWKMTEDEYGNLREDLDSLKDKMDEMVEGDEGDGVENEDDEDEDEDEDEVESSKDEEGDGPTLSDIHDTVKETNSTVKSVQERVDELEDEVFEKDDEEQAEKAVKSVFGIDEDLPDDEDERREVVRKHVNEMDDGDGFENPQSWSEDDIDGVMN